VMGPFSMAFGAMLLSVALCAQTAWGWSALRAGLALSPGPLMVPIVSFGIAGRLIRRFGPAIVIGAGSLSFAAGVAWWALNATVHPNYWSGVFAGNLLNGIGVGLVLPTMMATASSSLPAQSFATGSAVVNMLRQTGLALGVAILVAVLGSHSGRSLGALTAYRHAWWVISAIAAGGLLPAAALLRRSRQPAPAPTPAAAVAAAGSAPVGVVEGARAQAAG